MTDLTDPTSAQVAEFRDAWSAAGHDLAQFDAALAGTPHEGPQDPFAALTEGDLPSSLQMPALDAQQAHDLAAELRKAGVSEDQISQTLAADGYDPLAPDTRTEEQVEYDRAFSGGRPEDYKVSYEGRAADLDAAELSQFNDYATAWLSSVEMPPAIGAYVIERAMDVGKALSRMGDGERALWRAEQAATIERLAGGPDEVNQLRLHVAAVIERGEDLMSAGLIESGALDDTEIFTHLARHGERLAWRG